jgi:hypothetical protein
MAKLLPHTWDVPQRFRERLGTQAGRQRTMAHEGHLLLVLHDVPAAGDPTRQASFFWRTPDGTWKSTGAAAKGGIQALRSHVEAFAAVTQALEERVDNAARAADYFGVLQEAAPLLRTARNLHKALQEAREACAADRDLISIRDQAGDVERMVELVHADAKNGLDFTIARRAEEQAELAEQLNRSSHRLNMIAALFLPISALGGMLGMNLEHGLERWHAPWTFWIVLTGALMLGLLVRTGVRSTDGRDRVKDG